MLSSRHLIVCSHLYSSTVATTRPSTSSKLGLSLLAQGNSYTGGHPRQDLYLSTYLLSVTGRTHPIPNQFLIETGTSANMSQYGDLQEASTLSQLPTP
ncbi:hypothetical protein F5Y14DRAFT_411282 [Nemania sp. NC0429]|nr:hypothetical protein F5Y14DRAFT_411282 [Nemania sp. NC0429]